MNLSACTQHINDPRDAKNQIYSLDSLLLIIFSSILCGYDTPRNMVKFAELKFEWLQKYTDIKSIPCAETIRAILVGLKASEIIEGFKAFVPQVDAEKTEQDMISLDGKTMRGTRRNGNDAIHMLSAWSSQNSLTLFAQVSEGKKNEIKTLPKVIEKLNIENAILTIDAMGCQKAIAEQIFDQKGDYVLQLKANQSSLLEEIKAYHHMLERDGYKAVKTDVFEEIDKGHGRLEVRKYQQFELTNWIKNLSKWKGIKTAVRVERYRKTAKGESTEISWYISSLEAVAEKAAKAIRCHWEVESKLHWRLDVIFKDDDCQQASAAAAMGVIKRFCMNLLTINDRSKEAMVRKVMSCAISDNYREKILFGG